MRNGKVGSQVSDIYRSRSLGEEPLGKLGEEGEPAIERRREYRVFELDWGERK